jgi:catechol 2,3-dioxygenase-like lactoylglutathione lyase family enzyme
MNSANGTTTVKRISPMLAVVDMDQTLDFYTNLLGFRVIMKSSEYSIVERDGATIHFLPAADESVMQAVGGHTEIYIEVNDIHALWKHVDTHRGEYKIKELFDQPYGMTEFHIGDPNDCLVFVGQPTKQK